MGLSGRRRGRVFMQERLQPRPSAPSPAKAGEGWGGVPFGSARTVGTPSQPPPAFAGGGAKAERDDYNAPVKFLASLVLSSLVSFAAHAQVDGPGDYLSRLASDGDGRISLVEYPDGWTYTIGRAQFREKVCR